MVFLVPAVASDASLTALLTQIAQIGAALTAGGTLSTGLIIACALLAVRSKGCCSQDGIFRSHVI